LSTAINLLVCLNLETYDIHIYQMKTNGIIIGMFLTIPEMLNQFLRTSVDHYDKASLYPAGHENPAGKFST